MKGIKRRKKKEKKRKKKKMLSGRELNPGLSRDRRGY